jgi:general secretion pathway protein M
MDREWLTGRRGRALALAATVLVCLLVWAGMVQPLLSWYGDRAETLRQQRALAERMESLAATLPQLRRDVAASSGEHAAPGATLHDSSDAVASATMQERVQAMAAAAGATLTSIETLPAENTAGWRRIGLRLTLTAPWPDLVRLLQALDDATPRMLADDLHVHRTLVNAKAVAVPLQTTLAVYSFRASTADAATADAATAHTGIAEEDPKP